MINSVLHLIFNFLFNLIYSYHVHFSIINFVGLPTVVPMVISGILSHSLGCHTKDDSAVYLPVLLRNFQLPLAFEPPFTLPEALVLIELVVRLLGFSHT